MQSTNESQSQHQPTASRSSILGFVVQSFGYTVGFITLACIAVGGLIFFALLMPETKPEEGIGSTSAQGAISFPKRAARIPQSLPPSGSSPQVNSTNFQ
jgi:hypothetical protein